ncbi:hypothetical protein BTJ40_10720 [Microbulbifer sp. A4B17]|uniref:RHS repeat domain-containing protein n=1 Tax=Microbulbifer sp. A4B17 TaxID=359370 RepID=UPI000D52B101|nr:RHS repeat-associated core domain-containing protein [Microbulbifer sp. A4B17]AWF81252.1 hypothetical protein BTJ40_10720 [Microbulbifer sp. A4B17]
MLGGSQSDATPTARDRFQYGPDGQRFYRESSWMEDGQLQTEKAFIVGSYQEQIPADASLLTIEKTQLAGNVQHIAITDLIGTSGEYQYLHRDHLGSIEKITDEAGLEILDLSFNPDGSRRQTDWSTDLDQQGLQELLAVQGLTTKRGYTGHEHLDRTGLIHMNGRIYDPTLGRFLSPDPIVKAPTYSQNWNRYSYVFNNPLSFTDPSGFAVADEDEDVDPIDEGQDSGDGDGDGDGDGGTESEVSVTGTQVTGAKTVKSLSAIDAISGGTAPPLSGNAIVTMLKEKQENEPSEFDCEKEDKGSGCVSVTVDKDGNNAQKSQSKLPQQCGAGVVTCKANGTGGATAPSDHPKWPGKGYTDDGRKIALYSCSNSEGSCSFYAPSNSKNVYGAVLKTTVTSSGELSTHADRIESFTVDPSPGLLERYFGIGPSDFVTELRANQGNQ